MIESVEERKKIVKELQERFAPVRVNLEYNDGSFEAVLALPVSDQDEEAYKLETLENVIKLRLLNQPLGWAGAKWGMEIIAHIKNYAVTPSAYEQENYDRYLVDKNITISMTEK